MNTFQKLVYSCYAQHGRDLPWRRTHNPYRILVSEVMLQQTQVSRVLKYYSAFIRAFPSVSSLAGAPLGAILKAWQGLGYNRRALALKKTAQKLVLEFKGKVPRQRQALKSLPGIGEATSGAICVFAFHQPEILIETNIRSAFIHHFFKGQGRVSDARLIPYIVKTLDRTNPRAWYYALMDYGVYLKAHKSNPSRRSLHYRKQSPFKNSNRQVRGKILKELITRKHLSVSMLCGLVGVGKARLMHCLEALRREGLIKQKGCVVSVA